VNTKKLEEHSNNTRKQAETLLQSTKLLDILKKFGNVHIVGSYPLNIMYGPDIDILVESKDIRNSSIEALQEIIKSQLFRKVEYGDFVKFPMENRPKGYILVLKAIVDKINWEIEVWFLENVSKELNYYKSLKSKITEQNRIKILEAKHLRNTSNTDKHLLSSYEIYKQILGTIK
jgi:hypothetical protein